MGLAGRESGQQNVEEAAAQKNTIEETNTRDSGKEFKC